MIHKQRLNNRILSLVLALVMVLGMLPLTPFTVQALEALSKDTDGYYLIKNEEELFAFAELVNNGEYSANAKLTANIAMTGQSRPWTPIAPTAAVAQAYSGTFDGQGYVISNLYFNDSNAIYAGLFGLVNGGTVKNVTVSDGSITASYSGAIAARLWNNGVIEGCGNLNTTVSGYYAGGIVGYVGGTILASWNTGTVTGEWAGGICSFLAGTVRGCWNIGRVTATSNAGGIVGTVNGTDTVSHCYSDGFVTGDDYQGAIVGASNNASSLNMSDCYYTWISGSAWYAYGVKSDFYFDNVEDVDNSMLPTGGAAHLLNQGLTGTGCQFYQNLDNGEPADGYPVLDSTHGTVYSGYNPCSTEICYSNSPLSQTFYHSGVAYTKDGVTIREVCTNQSCANPAENLGSVTLKASDAYYTGNPVSVTAESSLTGDGTYKITYNNGATTAPSTIGTHTATLTVSENGTEKQSVTAEYKISYLLAPSPAYSISGYAYEDGGVYWFKGGTAAEVLAPAGYAVSTALDGVFEASATLSESDSKAVYLKRDSDGAITAAIDLSTALRFDSTAPTGKIALSDGNSWEDLLSKISFGLFFKEAKTATVTAADAESGVNTIAYYIASEDLIADNTLNDASAIAKLENAIAGSWKNYNSEIVLNQNAKNIVYVRITDNVGNATYRSSEGIVLYTDAQADPNYTTVYTTYGATGDVTVKVNLNGNTIKSVKYNNDQEWIGSYCSVDGDTITLKGQYLASLGASSYPVTVHYDPQGETYVVGGENDSPATTAFTLVVKKADYDMTSAKWEYHGAFDYDGLEKTVAIAGLPDGVTVSGYTGNTATKVGKYTAAVTFTYDSDNYNAPVLNDLAWEIKNDWTPAVNVEYTVSTPNSNGWLNDTFVITAADGYTVSLTNTASGAWEDKLTYTAETANGSVTFYLKNETDGTISLAKTVAYKIDTTPAGGTVEFAERKSWQDFVNTITFGLFYKNEVTVKAEAADNLSGIESIEYFASDKAMTLDEVKAITDWAAMSADGVAVTLEDTKQFVYYIRITDKAGNVIYLSTDGAEYDITAPVISDIENGKTYYTTQKVAVTDKNIDSITLNGVPVTGTITLTGNKDAVYTVTATDKAGNSTTVTVTMKLTESVGAPLDGITEDNVTSEDKDTIQDVIDQVEDLLDDEDLTEEEKATLEEIKEEAEKLIEKIEEVIDRVEKVEQQIENLPDTITKDDTDDVDAAKKAYDELSNYEKTLIDPVVKAKLDDAVKAAEEVNKPADSTSPDTGDNSNIPGMFVLMVGSLAAMFAIIFGTKKKKEADNK